MDHKVEDDIDVESAGAEDAEAVRLEEHGLMGAGSEGGDGGVEALEMAYLDEATAFAGEADEGVGLLEG